MPHSSSQVPQGALLEPYSQNNDPLPSNLAASLHDTLYQLSKSIADYDGDISHMERELERLREQRNALWARKRDLHRLVSPVRRLPVELVVLIMRETVSLSEGEYRPGVAVLQNFGRLRSICRTWRAIAHSVSDFWRGPPLANARASANILQGLCSVLHAWYTPAPFGTQLDLSLLPWSDKGVLAPGTAQQLISYMHASGLDWKTLSFARCNWTTEEYSELIQGLLTHSTPWNTVDKVELQFCQPSAQCLEMLGSLEAAFPNLNELALTTIPWRMVRSTLSFSHRSIRNLVLSGIEDSPGRVASFLKGFPRLDELVFSSPNYGDDIWNAERGEYSLTSLPSLKRLQLWGASSLKIMDVLTCPSLSYLALCGDLRDDICDKRLPRFTARCAPTHLTLALENCSGKYTAEDLSEILPELVVHRLYFPSFEFFCQVAVDQASGTCKLPDTVGQVVCASKQPDPCSPSIASMLRLAARRTPLQLWSPDVEAFVCGGRRSEFGMGQSNRVTQLKGLFEITQHKVTWLWEEEANAICNGHLVQSLDDHWTYQYS